MLCTMYTSVCVCVQDLCPPCCGQTSVNLLIPCVCVNVLESWRMIGQIDSYQVFSCFTITLVFCSHLSFLTVWGPDGSFNVHSYGMFGCAFTRTYCGRTFGIHGWQLRGRSTKSANKNCEDLQLHQIHQMYSSQMRVLSQPFWKPQASEEGAPVALNALQSWRVTYRCLMFAEDSHDSKYL